MANSATSFKLGEPIPSGPIKKIQALQTVFGEKGQSDSRSNYIQLQQAIPWIRMQSGVYLSEDKAQYYNAESGYDLAKRNILFGSNTRIDAFDEEGNIQGLQSFNPDGGILPGYDISRNFGIRPKPGITGMGIHSHNRFGSLRTAVVNFQCWSKEQIDALEVLFMRPGYSVLLEWGHSKVLTLDTDGNPTGVDDIGKGIDFYEDEMNIAQRIRKRIQREREKNHFGYDAILGTIKNFSWKLRKDGGYDCTTSLVTTGDLIESYKGNFFLSQQKINEDLARAAEKLRNSKTRKNRSGSSANIFPILHTDAKDVREAIPPAAYRAGAAAPIVEAMQRWQIGADKAIQKLADYLQEDFRTSSLDASKNLKPGAQAKLIEFINGIAAGNPDVTAFSTDIASIRDCINTGVTGYAAVLLALIKAVRALEVVRPKDPDHAFQGYDWVNMDFSYSYWGTGASGYIPLGIMRVRAYKEVNLNSEYDYLVDLSGVTESNGFDGSTDVNFRLPGGGLGAFQVPWEKRAEIFKELEEATEKATGNTLRLYYPDFMIMLGNIVAGVAKDATFLASKHAPKSKQQEFFFQLDNIGDDSQSGYYLDSTDHTPSYGLSSNYTYDRMYWGLTNNESAAAEQIDAIYRGQRSPTGVVGTGINDEKPQDLNSRIGALTVSKARYANFSNIARNANASPSSFPVAAGQSYYNQNGNWKYLNIEDWNESPLRTTYRIGRDPSSPNSNTNEIRSSYRYVGQSQKLGSEGTMEYHRRGKIFTVIGDAEHPYVYDLEYYKENLSGNPNGYKDKEFNGHIVRAEHHQPGFLGGLARFLVLQWNGYDPGEEVDAEVVEGEDYTFYDPNDDYISKLHYYLRQWIHSRYSARHLPVDFTGNGFSDIFKYRVLPGYDEAITQLFPSTGPSTRSSTPSAVLNSLKMVFGGRFVAHQALEKRNYVFVQLRVILELINRHVLKSDSEYFFTFQTSYTSNPPKYFTFDDHYSVDPRVCILSHQKDLNRTAKGSGFLEKSYEILDIEVSIDFVLEVLNRYIDIEGKAPLLDVVQSILDGITKVCGGQNEFDLQYSDEDAVFHVVDRRVLSTTDYTELRDSTQINVFGLSSIVKDVNLVSKITPKMSSMIAISAQDSAYTSLEESTGFNGLNRGLTDRVYTKRYEVEKQEVQAAAGSSYTKTREELKKRIEGLIEHLAWFYEQATIPDYTVGSQVGAYQNFCKMLYGSKVDSKGGRVGSNFIIPFELQMTLYGISGIRVMDSFIISQDLLPRTYGGDFKAPVGFLVTGVEHHVDRNQWVTKIKSQIFNLGDVAEEDYTDFAEDLEIVGAGLGGGTSATGECRVLNAIGNFSGGTEYRGIAWQTKYVPKGSEKETNVKILIDGLMDNGITNKALIIGILGTVGKESGFKPKNEYGYGNTSLIRLRNHFGWRNDQKDEVKRLRKTMDPNDKNYPKWCYGPLSEDTDKWIEDNKTDNVAFYDHIYGNISVQRIPGKKESRGNPGPGDGWKFRGRGFNQITFKPAYEKYSELVYGDSTLINDPDKLNEPKIAARVCAEFMKSKFQYKAFRNAGVTIDNITNVSDGVYWAVFANHGGSREVCKKEGYKEAVEIAKTFRIV